MDPVVTTVLSCDIASDRVGFEGLSYRGPMDQEAQGLVALFRAAQSTNNVALTRLEERYSEGTFPAAPLTGRATIPGSRGPGGSRDGHRLGFLIFSIGRYLGWSFELKQPQEEAWIMRILI